MLRPTALHTSCTSRCGKFEELKKPSVIAEKESARMAEEISRSKS